MAKTLLATAAVLASVTCHGESAEAQVKAEWAQWMVILEPGKSDQFRLQANLTVTASCEHITDSGRNALSAKLVVTGPTERAELRIREQGGLSDLSAVLLGSGWVTYHTSDFLPDVRVWSPFEVGFGRDVIRLSGGNAKLGWETPKKVLDWDTPLPLCWFDTEWRFNRLNPGPFDVLGAQVAEQDGVYSEIKR
jgi:hypothetical protein